MCEKEVPATTVLYDSVNGLFKRAFKEQMRRHYSKLVYAGYYGKLNKIIFNSTSSEDGYVETTLL